MDNIYERLGVRTIINAAGPTTRLSGALMHEARLDSASLVGAELVVFVRHGPPEFTGGTRGDEPL